MDFARQQRDPTRHLIGIGFVILIHLLVVYALVTGLARREVEVIKKPLTATIVEEIKAPPPPPPPPKKIEIPKVPPPPQQPYVPPPDIPVPTISQEPVISAVTPTPPPEPPVIAPPVVAPPPPPAPPKPAVRKGIVPISRVSPEYPREARRKNIDSGRVIARLNIDEKGNVTDVKIVEANPARVFDRAVIDALLQWKFQADGEKYVGEIEVEFKLTD
ncbi:MAG: energy transducer TonB [Betaproteobacteria bacterium]|nr:MAG: energy transducer TonB [Betaproteobacteria bacterium]